MLIRNLRQKGTSIAVGREAKGGLMPLNMEINWHCMPIEVETSVAPKIVIQHSKGCSAYFL